MTGINSVSNKEIENLKDVTKTNEDFVVVGTDYNYTHKILWPNAIFFLTLHLIAVYGLGLAILGKVTLANVLFQFIYGYLAGIGVTAGAHRLLAHKSYQAHPAVRFSLILLQTNAGQNCLFKWVRDHRLHHRYSDTDADPHNSKRGFFFSHIGWLITDRHPLVLEHSRKVDLSDLEADWMVMFQKRYYYYLYVIFAMLIPTWIPVYLFGDSVLPSFIVNITRYAFTLNNTWLVNSAAHLYGTRPYDKNIQSVENWLVSILAVGEGWHNYHHAYPWDYKAAELPYFINITTMLLDLLASAGLVKNRKYVSKEAVQNRIKRSGDGTHNEFGYDEDKKQVSAIGPVHPLNPTYNVTYEPPKSVAKIFVEKKISV